MDIIIGFIILYLFTGIVLTILSKITGIPLGEESGYDSNEWYGGGPDPMSGI